MRDPGHVISLVLTWVLIVLTLDLFHKWGYRSYQAARTPNYKRQAAQWLMLGIIISYTGGFFDNDYWGLAWSADYSNWKSRDWLFEWGAVFNIPFRQIAGVIGLYCHLMGYYMVHWQDRPLEERTEDELRHDFKVARKILLMRMSIGFLLGIIYIIALNTLWYVEPE